MTVLLRSAILVFVTFLSAARSFTLAALLGVATVGSPAVVACSNVCCPIDPAPNCCMRYGGHGSCGYLCDGMPLPSDPGWKIEQDDLGCDVWVNENAPKDYCGSLRGRCCAADPSPACCMSYGGWSESGQCTTRCDGPLPSDPSWAKTKDSHGCDVWTSASTGPTCNVIPGLDAGKDAADSGSD